MNKADRLNRKIITLSQNFAVRRELEKLHQMVESMGITVKQLRDRLQPILKLQDTKSLVPLAEEIHQIQLKLYAFDNDMQEIINACEWKFGLRTK